MKTQSFMKTYLDENFKTKTDENGIVIFEDIALNEKEALEIVGKAIHEEQYKYGYKLAFIENGIIVAVTFRNHNVTTKKRESASEYIKKIFN